MVAMQNSRWNLYLSDLSFQKLFSNQATLSKETYYPHEDDLVDIFRQPFTRDLVLWLHWFLRMFYGFSRFFWMPTRWLKHVPTSKDLCFFCPKKSRRPGFDMVRTRGILSILRYPYLVISYIAMVKPWPIEIDALPFLNMGDFRYVK